MTTLISDLWAEHRSRLRGYIAKRVREDDAVDDILQDVFQLADLLGASVTPEAYLFDTDDKLIYHGRIDNSKNLEQVKTHDLRGVLESHLSGKPVEKQLMKAFGCIIQRVK